MKTFEALINEFLEWSLPTFSEATAISSLAKASDEIEEVKDLFQYEKYDPNSISFVELPVEYADIIMCVFDSAMRAGITPQRINIALEEKININKNRQWEKNLNKTYSHVKGQH
jgi:hypothetical protein